MKESRMKLERMRQGKSAQQLGQETGMLQQSISLYENKRLCVKQANAEKIARALNVPVSELFDVVEVSMEAK